MPRTNARPRVAHTRISAPKNLKRPALERASSPAEPLWKSLNPAARPGVARPLLFRQRRSLADRAGEIALDVVAPLAFVGWGVYYLVTGDGFSAQSGGPAFFNDYLRRAGLYLVLIGLIALIAGIRQQLHARWSAAIRRYG